MTLSQALPIMLGATALCLGWLCITCPVHTRQELEREQNDWMGLFGEDWDA